MRIYYPGTKFPSLSVTGKYCALRCKHCMAHYLEHMIPVETPEKLIEFVKKNVREINGFLLSGGSTREGKVPLKRYTDAIRWIKENTNLLINIHTGVIEVEDMDYLNKMNPDHISFDIVGSTEVIKDIFGLNRRKEDYYEALELLDDSKIPYSPHLIVGLDYGKVWWEYETIEFISNLKKFSNLVLLVLLPTPKTPMENVRVNEDEVIDILEFAVNKIKPSKIVLGCMRPRNMLELERRAVDLGIKGIVLPSLKTRKYAEKSGVKLVEKNLCCVF